MIEVLNLMSCTFHIVKKIGKKNIEKLDTQTLNKISNTVLI